MGVDHRRIAEALGNYYVYILTDPRDSQIFYVGKGTGQRYSHHGLEAEALGSAPDEDVAVRRAKLSRIREIRTAGLEPGIEIVRRKLDEPTAFEVEAALIDGLGDGLTNSVRGHRIERGRMTLAELERQIGAPILKASTHALLIKLGDWGEEVREDLGRRGAGYRANMTPDDLYQSTRGIWRLSRSSAVSVKYGVAVYSMITRGIWEIDPAGWERFPDNSGFLRWRWTGTQLLDGPVWTEFVGSRGHRVPDRRSDGRWVFGNQAPIAYWP
jgi:hypothetical protein